MGCTERSPRALAVGAAKYKLPFVYSDIEYVMAGGLLALGPEHSEGYYAAAKYVDSILPGASPAQLPIAGPTQFTMSANRTALKNLGISLPSELERHGFSLNRHRALGF